MVSAKSGEEPLGLPAQSFHVTGEAVRGIVDCPQVRLGAVEVASLGGDACQQRLGAGRLEWSCHFVGNARGDGGSVVGSVEVLGAVAEFGSDAVQVGDEETGVDLLELADRTVKHGHRAVLVASQGHQRRDGRRIGLFAALAELGGEWRELIGQGTGGGDVAGF